MDKISKENYNFSSFPERKDDSTVGKIGNISKEILIPPSPSSVKKHTMKPAKNSSSQVMDLMQKVRHFGERRFSLPQLLGPTLTQKRYGYQQLVQEEQLYATLSKKTLSKNQSSDEPPPLPPRNLPGPPVPPRHLPGPPEPKGREYEYMESVSSDTVPRSTTTDEDMARDQIKAKYLAEPYQKSSVEIKKYEKSEYDREIDTHFGISTQSVKNAIVPIRGNLFHRGEWIGICGFIDGDSKYANQIETLLIGLIKKNMDEDTPLDRNSFRETVHKAIINLGGELPELKNSGQKSSNFAPLHLSLVFITKEKIYTANIGRGLTWIIDRDKCSCVTPNYESGIPLKHEIQQISNIRIDTWKNKEEEVVYQYRYSAVSGQGYEIANAIGYGENAPLTSVTRRTKGMTIIQCSGSVGKSIKPELEFSPGRKPKEPSTEDIEKYQKQYFAKYGDTTNLLESARKIRETAVKGGAGDIGVIVSICDSPLPPQKGKK